MLLELNVVDLLLEDREGFYTPPHSSTCFVSRGLSMTAFQRIAIGGSLPFALVGAEIAAYEYRRRKTWTSVDFTPGSFEEGIEVNVSSLDLVFFRRKAWKLGPLTGLVTRCVPGMYDSVGAVVIDRSGVTMVVEANLDGTVSMVPFSARITDPDVTDIAIRTLAWPERRDNEKVNLFVSSAMLQAAEKPRAPRGPWWAARDARFAPAILDRANWPAALADADLPKKLEDAVSPSATLILELYCAVGAMPKQYRATPYTPADFVESDPPLRKGAKLMPPVSVKVSSAS